DVLPDSLHDFVYRHAVQVDSGQDFDVHVGRLVRAIERLVPIDGRTKDEAGQGAPPVEPARKAERPVEAGRQAQEERRGGRGGAPGPGGEAAGRGGTTGRGGEAVGRDDAKTDIRDIAPP